MGRPALSQPPIPIEVIREHFSLRQDGEIIRRRCHVAAFAHEPAVFAGPKGVPMVRLSHDGKIRRVQASRVAWALSRNEWPRGRVTLLGGERDFRPENLRLVRGGQNPASVGRSSLAHRRAVDAKLIVALANHPGLSVVSLGELVGLSESGACIRLGKLAARGLTQSPQCAPGRSWLLTTAGRELAMTGKPLLDDLDLDLLRIVAQSPARLTRIAAEVGVCNFTIRRRIDALIARGLVETGPRFTITGAGRELLGDASRRHGFGPNGYPQQGPKT
jgi:predicted transcriptional regulator